MKTLLLLRHLPGAGASTLAPVVADEHFAADDFFTSAGGEYAFNKGMLKEAHAWCLARTTDAMARGVDRVAVHNTFTRAWEMEPYERAAQDHGYWVAHLIVENRHGGTNAHGVPADHMVRMRNRFDVQLAPKNAAPPGFGRSLAGSLDALKGVMQRPDYHPETNAFEHTLFVIGQALQEHRPVEAVIAALFHDLGKIETTAWNPERCVLTSYGHAEQSVRYVEAFWNQVDVPGSVDWAVVEWLVAEHMNGKFAKGDQLARLQAHEWWPILERFVYWDDMPRLFNDTTEQERTSLFAHAFVWCNRAVFKPYGGGE